MSGEIVAVPSENEIARLEHIANNLAGSGLFKDATAAKQAFAKMMYGRDLGLSPTVAMTALHVVEGKPELSANLQAQLVKSYIGPEGERYDYLVREHTDTVCEIEFRRREPGGDWETIGVERFTIDDATRAGLAGRKGPWQTYPRNMLWARCISNGVNFHCPEVARGLRVYHEGEISGQHPEPPPPPQEPDAEPVIADAIPLLGAGDRATRLATRLVAAKEAGVEGLVTMLQAHGATDDTGWQAMCASLPANQVDSVEQQIDRLLDNLTVGPAA